jgi:hypothetical protein
MTIICSLFSVTPSKSPRALATTMDAMAQVLIVRSRLSILALSLFSATVLGTHAGCNTAFYKPDDTFVQVACQVPNVGTHVHQIRFAYVLLLGQLGNHLLRLKSTR